MEINNNFVILQQKTKQQHQNLKIMKTEIFYTSIIRETAKAVLVSLFVNWGDGGLREKEIWMPKSVIESTRESNGSKIMMVAEWFIEKSSIANSYKGYRMNFNTL